MNAQTIAVIDDDVRVLESLQNLLASCGYRAATYPSAEQFLAMDDLSQTHCIIADVEMRSMTGLDLLHHVRSSRCEIPVIIISGKPSAKAEAFYLNRGANAFFRKPIDGQALMTLIEHWLK